MRFMAITTAGSINKVMTALMKRDDDSGLIPKDDSST